MKKHRGWVPFLGIVALLAMFLKMPEIPSIMSIFACKTCTVPNDPYVPLFGAAYFSLLLAIAMLFPTFPSARISFWGLVTSVIFALILTVLHLPSWCLLCLVAHACNIGIWAIWGKTAKEHPAATGVLRERLYMVILAPLVMVGLLSGLNLTFKAYDFKVEPNVITILSQGDKVPTFKAKLRNGRSFTNSDISQARVTVIDFVSVNCPYCREQLNILNKIVVEAAGGPYRFLTVSTSLDPELLELSPKTEWVDDKEGHLQEQFKVSGYPTLFLVGTDGKIIRVVHGMTDDLEEYLRSIFIKNKDVSNVHL